ncbi:zincin-like metallopeptidase domain-containing protein [uncultured Brachyspira sp.]|jgi:putative DNA primase/helicase|uniref:zincin-like metallopeptidase domain-containing protein n=1 Tax=uncultured Brachyspira sp. TaxID=221953 RepID=UPI0026124D8C|nr:zincin-like metallopeptidase domain-containing protein [uncultured Brachyspira sp.]
MDKVNKYQELANKFADLIETNEAPWQKTWSGKGFLPYNIKSEKEYNGMNLLNLMMATEAKGYEDNRWLTFLQAGELGAKVRPGEKGMHIMFLQTKETKKEIDEITGEEQVVTVKLEKPRAMWSVVFNAEQCEGLPAYKEKLITFNPIERAQEILDNSGAKIIHKKQNEAFYNIVTDTITLPLKEQFQSPEAYYRCALHELGHWTAHEKRNNRDLSGGFGSESYAREELVAEITSFLVGTQCGLGHEPNDNNVAYLKSWSKAIRDDPSYLFKAVKDADKAAQLILGKDLEMFKTQEKVSENIKDIIKQADLEYASRTYVNITNDYKFYMYEEELHEQGKSWKDFNVLYDEAHKSYYIKQGNLEEWKASINIDENIKQIFTPNKVDLNKYYLDIDEYIMDSMVGKPNPEKIAEHYGFKYEKETGSFYCNSDEREKYLPWSYDFNIKSNEDKLYLNITEKEAEKLIAYNVGFDGKNYYIHKDLQDIYTDIAKEIGINNMFEKDNLNQINKDSFVTYINVPKAEKDEAKSLGAKWDKNNICWFVPADVDISLFDKWEKIDEKDLAVRKEQMLQANNANYKAVNQQENKYILAVPYDEKDLAKALGAEWDKDGKFWYCQESEKDKFFQWDIKNVENKVKSDIPLNIEEEFLNRIKAGGVIENTVIADGEKHRIAVDGDKGKEQSGFYVLHADGIANGYFMNNRTGEEIKWSSKEHSYNSMTPEEKAEMKALYQARKAEREQEDKILTEKAEKALYAKFMNKEAINEHTYLSNKMIEPTQNIYAGNDNTITVPLYNVDGRLKSAQYVSEDGEKRFAKNTDKVGAFHVVDGNAADLKSATSIIIAEGYATAASINEAVKEPGLKVIAAMSASNIEHTVKAITEKYPAINIVIAADNDLNNKIGNIGLNAANAVADKYKNVTVIVPKINGKAVAGDFNDIISKNGLSKEEALKNIRYSIKPALNLKKTQEHTKEKEKSITRAI